MQLQQKTKNVKMTKVSVRAGFGGKLVAKLPMQQIKKFSANDLAKQVIRKNTLSSDVTTQKTAQSLQGILQDPFSDIDMRVHTPEEVIPTSREDLERHKLEDVMKRSGVETENVEELELAASRQASGGQ